MRNYKDKEIIELIENLLKYKKEPEWLEFKCNNKGFDMIGEYISALSNSAALCKKAFGYLVWGVDNDTHNLIGTDVDYDKLKKGNEDISLWLTRQLKPIPSISYRQVEFSEGIFIGVLRVDAAKVEPVKFQNIAYIRRGEHKKKLKDCPDLEQQLWRIFNERSFEELVAKENLTEDEVLKYIDYPSYFDVLDMELPSEKGKIVYALEEDKMVVSNDFGKYDITNMGALLFAKQLSDFETLERKAVRVIQYDGKTRIAGAKKEKIGHKGYAAGFEGLIAYINGLLPENEIMGKALRKTVSMYPELSVREVVANAIVHQDFSMTGTSVMIEIFDDRIEISNPGNPLIEIDRFVDHPPISRNEAIASFLRRIGLCEERGSGFDKVVYESEQYQLPAPVVEIFESHTRVILFAYKPFAEMDKDDRIRACYLHACLKRVNREAVTNASLRERFKIDKKNSSMISRLLRDTMDAGLIKLMDEEVGDRAKKYVPYWA